MTLFQFDWESPVPSPQTNSIFNSYKFDSVVIDGVTTALYSLSPFPYDKSYTVASSGINGLGLSNVLAVAVKPPVFAPNEPVLFSMILNVDTEGDVYMRIRNAENTNYLYLKGEVIPSIPPRYEFAYMPVIYMTTTTTEPPL